MRGKAVIFGSGLVWRLIKDDVKRIFDIIAILDNNIDLHGNVVDQIPIMAPTKVIDLQYDTIILASANSQLMAKQLISMGVPIDKIILGANFALNKQFGRQTSNIHFKLNKDLDIVSDDCHTKRSLVCVDFPSIDKNINFWTKEYSNNARIVRRKQPITSVF